MREDDDATADDGRTDRAADHNQRTMNPQTRTGGAQGDERAVSEVIGAILVFGLVLAVLALIQVSAVPAANQQIEFEHSQRVAGDFQQLDDNVERVAATGTAKSTRIETGVRYPTRIFLINPPPVTGELRTEQTTPLALENVRAQDPETAEFWTGTGPRQTQERESVSLNYRAGYNEYASSPDIRYETGILYREFQNPDEQIVVDTGSVISGRRIDLTVLDGSLSTSSVDETTLNAQPVSAPAQEISVTNANNPIEITVPTGLSEEKWVDEILANEIDSNSLPAGGDPSDCSEVNPGNSADETDNRYVVDCTYSGGQITITMEAGRTYGLRMAKIGLGDTFDEEPPTYLTTVEGDDSSITDAQTQQLTLQVRDRFNNPVGGVEVRFDAGTDGTFASNDQSTVTVTTNEDGEATAVFEPDGTGPATIDARATAGDLGDANGDVDNYEFVTFNVGVSSSTIDDDDGEGGRPDRLQDINTRDEDIFIERSVLVDSQTMDVTFRNQGDTERQLRTGRIAFVLASGDPDSATLTGTTGTPDYGTFLVGQPLTDFDNTISVAPGGTRTVRFAFDDTLEQSGGQGNFDAFYVFSTRIVTPNPTDPANPTDGVTQTFFISDGLGVQPFSAVSAGDVTRNQQSTTQTFTFTPAVDMSAGQTVTIDLNEAQGLDGTNPSPVDYRSASVAGSTPTGGTASLTASNTDASITYTVGSGGLSAGEQVTINLNGVRTQTTRTTVNGIRFSWSGGGSETTNFGVVN